MAQKRITDQVSYQLAEAKWLAPVRYYFFQNTGEFSRATVLILEPKFAFAKIGRPLLTMWCHLAVLRALWWKVVGERSWTMAVRNGDIRPEQFTPEGVKVWILIRLVGECRSHARKRLKKLERRYMVTYRLDEVPLVSLLNALLLAEFMKRRSQGTEFEGGSFSKFVKGLIGEGRCVSIWEEYTVPFREFGEAARQNHLGHLTECAGHPTKLGAEGCLSDFVAWTPREDQNDLRGNTLSSMESEARMAKQFYCKSSGDTSATCHDLGGPRICGTVTPDSSESLSRRR